MKKSSKISRTFIVFLCASLFIWVLIKLSKEYTSYVIFPVTYINLPQDKLLQGTPQKGLKVLVKGSGFRLISSNLSKVKMGLNTNKLEFKKKHNYYFLTSKLTNSIQEQIGENLEVKGFFQDSIFLNLGKLKSKKVIVKTTTNITFQLGYNLSKKIRISPDSVLIFGPEDQINKITQINTVPLNLDKVDSNIKSTLQLESLSAYENVRVNTSEIEVFGKVEKYTEGSLMVPFIVKNIPFGIEINTFPKEVKITFKVALSDFHLVTPKSFVVECNYNAAELNHLNYLIPKIIKKPVVVSSVKMVPNKIEFLIQK